MRNEKEKPENARVEKETSNSEKEIVRTEEICIEEVSIDGICGVY